MDIKPPAQRLRTTQPIVPSPAPSLVPPPAVSESQPTEQQPSGLATPSGHPWRKRVLWTLAVIFVILVGLMGGSVLWYHTQLKPVGTDTTQLKKITIEPESTPAQMGALLQKEGIIHSALAFTVYTRLSNVGTELQAGTYRLSPGESMQKIVDHLVKGDVDQFNITFLPGATLAENTQVLTKAGFSEQDINKALAVDYSASSFAFAPLFATKPPGSDLEGYIYGETYAFSSEVTVQDVLERAFSQYYTVVTDNNLVNAFSAHGLSLYQGITLASIIQREVHDPTDQKQVAQIFYSRLALDMPLGSDVTFIYAAKKLGVVATPSLDSPYNTRLNKGLPPGPISVPGLTALQAVASPASGNYLFFLSGDDGRTYYATTDAEHQANIATHCQVKCSQ